MSDIECLTRYLITGANGYLGRSLAGHLCAVAGNKVLTTSRGPSEFDKLPDSSIRRHLSSVDLLQRADIAKLVSAVDRWADGPFHVVNCAGYFPEYKSICETSLDEARRVFDSNVLALYAAAHALLPIMQTRGGGHFIAFSSHAVTQSYPLMAAFTAAKASVDTLVQSIANEYSKDGIVANALAIATLNSPKERQLRPKANSSGWLEVDQIIHFIEQMVRSPFKIMNGNTVHLFNYSESFFHQAYFDRLGLKPET